MVTDDNRGIIILELISLIDKGNAHASFEDAVQGLNLEVATKVPETLPYSIWQLVEHIRIAQWDIVEFCLSPGHQSPKWPDEYWPEAVQDITAEQWEKSLLQIREDRERFFNLLKDQDTDLYTPFSYGEGQSVFKEALLIADHNAYHTGEIIIIRRLLGEWKSK
jgi:hypothetical protein